MATHLARRLPDASTCADSEIEFAEVNDTRCSTAEATRAE
jgi:hypothetical protein